MRLHNLTFQAIGPYPTQQKLDFDQLDNVGLFLLDGPTGAGKSTILDIVTFALYGKADDERKNTELQSTLAEPGVPPTIQLEVSFGSRRFVIDRVLQHVAPRRGAKNPDDVVTRQASMALTEIVAGKRQQLTTRVDEAQQILRGVIGLSREQFTSVVLLPQGEFARFLKASSNDREEILRQLFNTHRFDDIADYLSQQAKKLRGEVEADSQRRDSLRASLIQLAAHAAAAETAEPETEDSPAFEELDDQELIAGLQAKMQALEAQAAGRVTDATTTLERAQKHLVELQEQAEHIGEATDYRQRRAAHDQQQASAQTAAQHLDDHARAKPVADCQAQLDTAQNQLTRAQHQWQQQLDQAQVDNVILGWTAGQEIFSTDTDADALLQQWKTVEATAIRALERVEYHEKTHAAIATQHHQLTQWQRTHTQLSERIDSLGIQLQQATDNLTADKSRAEELTGAEHSLETAQQRLNQAQEQHTAAQAAQQAQQRADEAQKFCDTAKQAAEEATEHATNLLRRRIDAAAGFLAETLEDGQPCEVCGSTNHPQPAEMQGLEEISHDAVQRAEQQATLAKRNANEAEETLQTQLATLHDYQTRAAGLTVADANDAVTTAQHDVETARQQAQDLAELRTRINKAETAVETLRETKTTAEQQLTEAATQVTTLTEKTQQAQQELAEALGEFESVEALRAAVEPAHRLVSRVVAQGVQVVTAMTERATAQQRVASALADSATDQQPAFTDAATAQNHVLAATTCLEYEDLVRRWNTERDRLAEKAGQTAVQAGLKLLDAEVEAPSQDTLMAANQAQQTAQHRLSEASRAHGSVQATCEQAGDLQQQLHEVSQRSAQQLATYQELVDLSDVVAGRGENAVSMPLRSFVLAGWLEQVAANASERLTGMTGGRYELQHVVNNGGRGHAGLNLEVIDHLNDTVRNPSTLSGGETFMASLALALGLADAVQSQAGGIAMDTLFIDEGFGSLDTQTLDDVMGVLDALQDDGRLIGLVSHVDSMKQQIPHRIQVHKTPTGSHVNVTGPDL